MNVAVGVDQRIRTLPSENGGYPRPTSSPSEGGCLPSSAGLHAQANPAMRLSAGWNVELRFDNIRHHISFSPKSG